MGLEIVCDLLPQLTTSLTKGECGRIGVVGGCAEYTGAPYFAAVATFKVGADLSHVFCPPAAAPVIKGYNPDLIVHPSLDCIPHVDRLDSFVFGPGLGREQPQRLRAHLEELLQKAKSKPVVIDADGLHLLHSDPNFFHRKEAHVILTPNHREFQRLMGDHAEEWAHLELKEQVKKTAQLYGVTILRKGEVDVISNGSTIVTVESPGCPRRCGGQGDLLSGTTAVFAFYAQKKNNLDASVLGAQAACELIRASAAHCFKRLGRPMTANDMINDLATVIRSIDSMDSKF
ncbi:hypothetical protein QR680_012172 [Steinernema hermaphroditum]|uniref:ATP-dependent (S)-NAD(P)H-hydrate dehydratase n=1 Tax=Steinernema hermaphroditum TaxID=289476 RepID=A0AA39I159_9BILA|nr:hypothetical protein QR680_012172 [Steinernema hermaphroditum]